MAKPATLALRALPVWTRMNHGSATTVIWLPMAEIPLATKTSRRGAACGRAAPSEAVHGLIGGVGPTDSSDQTTTGRGGVEPDLGADVTWSGRRGAASEPEVTSSQR